MSTQIHPTAEERAKRRSDVLAALRASGALTVRGIASHCGISHATALYLVQAMRSEGAIVQRGTARTPTAPGRTRSVPVWGLP